MNKRLENDEIITIESLKRLLIDLNDKYTRERIKMLIEHVEEMIKQDEQNKKRNEILHLNKAFVLFGDGDDKLFDDYPFGISCVEVEVDIQKMRAGGYPSWIEFVNADGEKDDFTYAMIYFKAENDFNRNGQVINMRTLKTAELKVFENGVANKPHLRYENDNYFYEITLDELNYCVYVPSS